MCSMKPKPSSRRGRTEIEVAAKTRSPRNTKRKETDQAPVGRVRGATLGRRAGGTRNRRSTQANTSQKKIAESPVHPRALLATAVLQSPKTRKSLKTKSLNENAVKVTETKCSRST